MFDDAAKLGRKDWRLPDEKDRATTAATDTKLTHLFEGGRHGSEVGRIAVGDELQVMTRLNNQSLSHGREVMFVPRSCRAPIGRVTSQKNAVPLLNGGQRPACRANDAISVRLDGRQIGRRQRNRGDVDSLFIDVPDHPWGEREAAGK